MSRKVTIKEGWHWPRFDDVLCTTLTDQERLGLPDGYRRDRFSDSYPLVFEQMRHLTRDNLLALCQNANLPLIERLVAGNLLGVLGDPRLNTYDPPMIAIEGGKVWIGLPPEEIEDVMACYHGLGLDRSWIAKESPRHSVALAKFAIGRYPITNQEYRDFLSDSGFAEIPDSWTFRRYPLERANHPVYTVSPRGADTYCQWLANKTGRAFRLPSESEWEYAASGPEGNEFPWGDRFDADLANTCETGLFTTTPVGIFTGGASPFGAFDMAGNVEEYVADPYSAYPGGDFVADHLVQIHGTYRVARGGTFARFRDLARTRRRHGHNPRSSAYAMGFRLAETLG